MLTAGVEVGDSVVEGLVLTVGLCGGLVLTAGVEVGDSVVEGLVLTVGARVLDVVMEGGHSKCVLAVLLSLMNVVVLTTTVKLYLVPH